MLQVILYEPEIPGNTGNIIRLCANTGAALHLVEPLGFELEDHKLRRAGLDYHEWARVKVHASLQVALEASAPTRVFGFSTKGSRHYSDVTFAPGDALLFGPESRGLSQKQREQLGQEQLLCLPMAENSRSLNLANSVAVAVYEAWRQLDFAPM